MTKLTLSEIHKLLPGSEIKNCKDPDSVIISCVSSLTQKKANSISFLSSKSHLKDALNSEASVILVNKELAAENFKAAILVVENVELALIRLLNVIVPPLKPNGTVSSSAQIHPTAKIGENTNIGNFVSIGENSVIGKNSILENGVSIGNNVFVGDNARIGMNSAIHHGVQIGDNFTCFGNCTFGGDGFGFYAVNHIYTKIPQVGGLRIGNDVEFGANSCADRGALQDTLIGDGSKFDNLVHIGHNTVIGKNFIMAGCSGVAGSTTIGDNVIVGGHCAISDHLTVPSETIVAGGTGIRNSPK
ncbi:MAG: UDP-3-O-(3-hydroxymyristoyl)glucosamine N-acyltransferase, partial [Leptospira sp.]|nr:UDP-3-O-(3-hydroxymyristoyl)glucosamine N-acyltransferase [Leptospira sp.]